MSFSVIIPARFASSRLPGKPLADICGLSMIQRVYEQALKSNAKQVIVATDHEAIEAEVLSFGGKVLMTRVDHESGTDRLAEVVESLGMDADEIVVNVQGDEPLIPPEVINQVASNLAFHSEASVSTVSEPVLSLKQYQNPNAVKVVSDQQGLALYFSRAPIPWYRDALAENDVAALDVAAIEATLSESKEVQKHIGIYAYRVSLLNQFVTWPMSALEQIEKLEQLRILANGKRIHVQESLKAVPVGIDTHEDLEEARAYFSNEGAH